MFTRDLSKRLYRAYRTDQQQAIPVYFEVRPGLHTKDIAEIASLALGQRRNVRIEVCLELDIPAQLILCLQSHGHLFYWVRPKYPTTPIEGKETVKHGRSRR